jgi:hypothetical protein
MWLRDFLSKDLPQCRTMIYGYNSKLSSHGVDTILNYVTGADGGDQESPEHGRGMGRYLTRIITTGLG